MPRALTIRLVLLVALFRCGSPLSPAHAQGEPAEPTASPPERSSPPEDAGAVDALQKRVQRLEKQLEELQRSHDEEELRRLRQEASTEAVATKGEDEAPQERTFVAASRSMQMLNPEISVSGDFLATVIARDGLYASEHDRSGFAIRALGIHIQSALDPFSTTKLALHVEPEHGVHLEELYITWAGLIPKLSLTLGKFRQLFGVLNRWHEHDLDQVTHPLALTAILGEEGLAQTGISLRWLMPPLWAHVNELTLEVTDGSNEELLAGEHFSMPAFLVHMKSYYDLTESTYLELGLSGIYGFNHRHGVPDPADPDVLIDEDRRTTIVGGADLTLHWEPLQRARYRSFTWRSEALWARKETDSRVKQRWGIYSYVQHHAAERWFFGVRGDFVYPMNRPTAQRCWQVVPYVTFWQSEFVYLRLEARHGDGFEHGRDTRFVLQLDWAAGPHKHEKY